MAKLYLGWQSSVMVAILPLVFLLAILDTAGAQTGVCYGTDGTDLPSPEQVIALYNRNNIKRMRIYSPDAAILEALEGSNIELILDVPNDQLESIASDQANANAWVENNVRSFPNVRFRYIAVGNEIHPSSALANSLFPAMRNIQNAVANYQGIRVSTSLSADFVENSSPPSSGSIKPEYRPLLDPIIGFLVSNGSPLLVNLYPFFSYLENKQQNSLDFALFGGNVLVEDPNNGLVYRNLFDAMLDAAYAALEKAGGSALKIVVSETGWPTLGEESATLDNARTYNNNLIKHVKRGTPTRPRSGIETYVFAMFDENKIKSPEYARNFGLFFPNMTAKYPISFAKKSGTQFALGIMVE